ncbi:ABC transporter ATP-binding protein [Rubrobacter aplysinae]|uniref:ABC transporter ATP-binding protein n=1 Tax=Rubrobacter aplysinae TaxID=909625 RepID=UPI00064C4018|nr:ABC transporter ATP-binding protein [Rubrobacter aplysinae]
MGEEVVARAEGLVKSFGSKEVVRGVDLEVARGSLYGFLGPNGAGKTTTIRMLAGLVRPSGGRAEVAGIDVVRDPLEAKRRIGLVPDEPRLFEKLTAREFMRFVGQVFRMEAKEIERRSGDLLQMFGLAESADELLGGYSHGMKQKCALASALLHEPEVLFLDEPTVGLDPASARLIKDVLRRTVERGGTVFMATHILEIAETLCDGLCIVQDGRVLATGTVPELRETAGASGGSSLEEVFLGLTGSGGSRGLAGYPRDER